MAARLSRHPDPLAETSINSRDPHSTIVSAFDDFGHKPKIVPASSIGAILVEAGRMTNATAETVLRYQRSHAIPFGEAAIKLGVATAADIEFALAHQFEYRYLRRGDSAVSDFVIAAYEPFSTQVEALRSLRTQLRLRMPDDATSGARLAIVSAEKGDGRSYIAANLAVVFAQLGERTLLVDADMRTPTQHELFAIPNAVGLSSMLAHRSGPEAIRRVPSLVGLSILVAGPRPPNPQELLGRPAFSQLLDHAASAYDVVIIDTPASDTHSEALTIASRAGSALVVARRDRSRVGGIDRLTRSMSHGRIAVLGAVLNDF